MLDGKKEIKAEKNSAAVDNSGSNNTTNINIFNQSAISSLLNPLLDEIIKEFEFDDNIENEELPPVEEKIEFNSVKVFANEIRDATGYMSLIEEIIDGFDDENPAAKKIFQKAIRKNYEKHRNSLFIKHGLDPADKESTQALICSNADKLIQAVANTILVYAEADLDHPVELVQSAQELIVAYGFINCKILEKPQ